MGTFVVGELVGARVGDIVRTVVLLVGLVGWRVGLDERAVIGARVRSWGTEPALGCTTGLKMEGEFLMF